MLRGKMAPFCSLRPSAIASSSGAVNRKQASPLGPMLAEIIFRSPTMSEKSCASSKDSVMAWILSRHAELIVQRAAGAFDGGAVFFVGEDAAFDGGRARAFA